MGTILLKTRANLNAYLHKHLPVILCQQSKDDLAFLQNAGYELYSFNEPFASALLQFPPSQRLDKAYQTAVSCFPDADSLILSNYEMLFDPRYQIDPIRFFIEIARSKYLVILWCGDLKGETLTYAEPGHPDYKQYRVSSNDLICLRPGGAS